MDTGEIISLAALIVSAAVGVTGVIVFFRNLGKDAADQGGARAKIESKIDFIKIQTELISAKSNAISEKLDDQNARLIVVEQKVEAAELCRRRKARAAGGGTQVGAPQDRRTRGSARSER